MKKMMKRLAGFITITLCCVLLLPLRAMADPLPVISDYNNLPEGYQAMGTEDTERSVKGSSSYLLVIKERVRQSTKEYTRDIIYDFSNLPGNTYFHTSQKQEFEGRNGRIVQSPGAAMTFHYTDKVTGPEEFLQQYKTITDEEYRNKSSQNIPDTIKIDTIGKYRAVHCTIADEQAEGYFQNEHWFIPLPTSIPHYGTAYVKLIVSNDVRIYGDLTVEEMPVIYEQWLEECLKTTENWVNELMKATYTVRAENLMEGPVSGDWPQPEDDPSPVGESQAQDEPTPAGEPQSGGDIPPVEEPAAGKEPVLPGENNSTNGERGADSNSDSNTEKNPDDFVDPAEAAILSVIAILLAILFGNTGGFVPPVSAGAGVPAGGGPIPTGDWGRWIKPDAEGDLVATDPVNRQQRTFVNNGDGTYTDPLTGATYTPQELSDQLEYRADNADTIRQDEDKFDKNVADDVERNKTLSDDSKKLEEELEQERQIRAHREKVERVATELGMSGASEDEVRQELARRMERDEDFRQKMHDYANRQDMAVDTLETTVEVADYAMAAGEALGGVPGKAVSATYKGIKNIGETVMEKGASVGSVVEGAIKGGTEAATTVMNSGIGKAGVTIGGTVAGEIADAVNDSKDVGDAIKEGFIKGTGNAFVGAVGDAVGDAAEGEGLLNKAAEVAEKLAETAYGKEFVDPNLKEKFGD